MMPLSKRIYLFSIRIYSHSKFVCDRHLLINKYLTNCYCATDLVRGKKNSTAPIKPRTIKPESESVKIGVELAGKLNKASVTQVVRTFFDRQELSQLVEAEGLDDDIFQNTKVSFIKFCANVDQLPTDLHILLCDLVNGHGHLLDLFPYFLQHVSLVYPHLKYKEELARIGDLTDPTNWYPCARSIERKIIFHYGPTNSGKTHTALKRFLEAKSGVYCAPLKLLAHEIFERANEKGVPCDLVTGEDKRRVLPDGKEAEHVSCTVEMVSVNRVYEVAVIDEVQMLKDFSRGFAWTRAFLGVAAKEIHLCGEESALNYIEVMAEKLGEKLQCHKYKRLTKLYLENKAVQNFKNIRDGDCIICFSKKDIYTVTSALEKLGIQCAVIYGNLPPGTKTAQTKLFNDPNNKCNVLVATDAVGLGINLNIRRIIFYSIEKYGTVGEAKKCPISVSQALQIAGRAGRFQSRYEEGFVTTFRKEDLQTLKSLLLGTPEPVRQAGLSPTSEQIETFSYYLPNLSLSELLDIFTSISTLDDSLFFICDLSSFKNLADQIRHIPLPIKTIYTFCCAPVNYQSIMAQILFVKFAKKFSLSEPVTSRFMQKFINWPLKKPNNIGELVFLEHAFDCLDMYLWFGNRFPLSFPDMDSIKALQEEIDELIMKGVIDLVKIVRKDMGKKGEDEDNLGNHTEVKIGEHLVQKGVLTPSLLAKLKKEWKSEMEKKENGKQTTRDSSKYS